MRHLVFVGAFPAAGSGVFGGMVTSCRALMESSFAERLRVTTLDTTQRTVPPPPLWRRVGYAMQRAARFRRLLQTERPDAVLLMCADKLSFVEKSIMAGYARVHGIPGILAPRGGALMDDCRRSLLYRHFAGALFSLPTVILCQGPAWHSFFTGLYGMAASRCPIVPNWTASRELTELGERRRYHDHAEVSVLFVGWLERTKGIFELLEAVDVLRADTQLPRFRLVLAGEGSASEEARAYVRQNGLDTHVEFLGWADGAAKVAAYRNADIFTLPSHAEGLPNAMVEAMAAGLPVVVTTVGSVPDVIEHEGDGLLIGVRDPVALAAALRRLIQDAGLREQLGRRAASKAQAQFGVELAARRLVDIVDQLCEKGR